MKSIRIWLAAGLALLFASATAHAQTYTHAVYLDLDRNTATGCSVTTPAGVVSGAEARVTATVSGQPPIVASVVREQCSGGVFGAAQPQPAGYPVGLNLGTGGSDVVEFSTALLGLPTNGLANLTFVSSSPTGADLAVAQGVALPGLGVVIDPAIVPTLGWFALLLLIAMMLWLVRRNPRFGASMAVLLLLGAGVAWAANFVMDGQIGDWTGVAPRTSDPNGDATSGEDAIELVAVFAQPEGARLFFRSDVVDAQNAAPTANAQSVTLAEEGTQTITLTATDPESAAMTFAIATPPTRGTLSAITPIDATSASVQYTGSLDQVGADSFTFTASDGQATSAPATVSITLTEVNDAPVVAPQALTVVENSPNGTLVGTATATDPDAGQTRTWSILSGNTGNAFAIASANGAITVSDANAVIPGNSPFNLVVQALDNGTPALSDSDTITITVTGVNDAPSFTAGGNQNANEDDPAATVSGWATAISAGPADEAGQTLSFIVANDNNPLFSVQPAVAPDGTLSYTLAPNANGVATVTVSLQDNGGTAGGGDDTSDPQNFTIAVAAVNDAPSFALPGSPNQTVLQDSGAASVPGFASAISAGPADESAQTLSFTVTNDANALFSVQPAIAANGTLSFTPATGQVGIANVTVSLVDSGSGVAPNANTSAVQSFTINVSIVNQPPTFDPPADPAAANEDAGAQTVPGFVGNIQDGDASVTQVVNFNVTNNSNGALFAVAPAIDVNGQLTYTPAPNANGIADITFVAQDNGGTAVPGSDDTSDPDTFRITVNAVNDVPSFTGGTAASALESAGSQTVANFHTAISPGPPDESGQTVSFTTNVVSTTGSLSFTVVPSVAPNGTLTFTATNGTFGTASVSSTLSDNGGTANGGVDTSAAQTFTITINNVNDPPVFTVGGTQSALEDAGPQTAAGFLTGIADGDDGTQTITFSVTNNTNPSLFSADPAIAPNGTLTWTPAANANGTATITVRAQDNGGTANGGNDTSATQTFDINVTAVNDAPSFTPGPDPAVSEDAGPVSIAWATAISSGPPDESGQSFGFDVAVVSGGALFSSLPTVSVAGQLDFTPAADASGSATFTVTLQDNGGTANGGADTSAPATLTITINATDDSPTAVNDTATVSEDATATAIPVLANDTDGDGGPISIISVTQPLNGTVVITGGGSGLTYQPNPNYCNAPPGTTPDTFTYTLAPGGSIGTVALTVTCVDDNPTAVNDVATITEDDPATAIPVLTNDTDPDAGSISVVSVTQPANGTVVITGGGSGLTYLPNPNYCNAPTPGTPDTFTYTLTPGGSTATVSVNVTCVVDNPVAVNDAATVIEDAAATAINVLGNDSNPDGSPISVGSVTQPPNGVVVITGGGTGLTYQPNANYCNTPPGTTPDTFTYTISPGGSVGTVTVGVTCVDDVPTAVADARTVLEDAAATAVNPLANDTDVDGGPISVSSVTQPANGTVVITGGGTGLTYQPNANYCNTASGVPDTFTYTLSPGGSSTTVTVTVTCVNDPPVADDETFETYGNTELRIDLAAAVTTPRVIDTTPSNNGVRDGDTDPVENHPTSVIGIVGCGDTTAPFNCTLASGAVLVMESDGKFTYTPGPGDATDSFQYTLQDAPPVGEGSAAQDVGLVTLTMVEMVWYVNAGAPAGGNGTSNAPLQSFVGIAGVGGAGDSDDADDWIYVHNSTVAGGIELEAGQRLIGEAVALSIGTAVNGDPLVDLRGAGTRPIVNNTGGNTVSIGNAIPREIRGLSLQGSTNAIDLTTTAVTSGASTLTVDNNVIAGAGAEGIDVNANSSSALILVISNNSWNIAGTHTGNAIDIANTNAGAATLRLDLSNNTNLTSAATGLLVNGGAAVGPTVITGFANNTVHGNTNLFGMNLQRVIFDGAAGNPITTVSGGITAIGDVGNRVGTSGLRLEDVRGDLSFGSLNIFSNNGTGLFVTSNAAFNAATGAGFRLVNSSTTDSLINNGGPGANITNATITLNPATYTVTGSASFGLNLDGVAGTFTAGSTSSIASPTAAAGTAFRINGSSVTSTFDGSIAATQGTGVSLTTNSGVMTFRGGLSLSTVANPAFTATGGGTVHVCDENPCNAGATGALVNTLATTTATALNVANTAIGASRLEFRSISSNGGSANGIVLDTTGSAGGLSVKGTGAVASGGTIANKTGADGSTTQGSGIYLNATSSVSLSSMQMNDFDNFAIRGSSVNDFSLTNSTLNALDGSPVNGTAQGEGGIGEGSIRFVNLTGTVALTDSTITHGIYDNVGIFNDNTSAALNFTASNTTFATSTAVGNGNDAIRIEIEDSVGGAPQVQATVVFNNDCDFTAARGDLIDVIGQRSQLASPAATAANAAIVNVTVDNNDFTNNHAGIVSGGGGYIIHGQGNVNFTVQNNDARDSRGRAVNISKSANRGIYNGRLNNNRIGVTGTASSGSTESSGLFVDGAGAGSMTMALTSNNVRQTNEAGVYVLSNNQAVLGNNGTMHATITGNLVAEPVAPLSFAGLFADIGTGVSSDATFTCLDVGGAGALQNDFSAGDPFNGGDINLSTNTTTATRLPGYAGGATDTTAVATYLDNRNANAAATTETVFAGGAGYVGGAACTQPP